jgi:hypothetical protein
VGKPLLAFAGGQAEGAVWGLGGPVMAAEGGLRIGGEAGQGEVLLAEGGLRIGGEAGQGEVLLAEGGLWIGGEAWMHPIYVTISDADGGLLVGGEAGMEPVYAVVMDAEGGLRIGGEAGQGEVLLAEGGLRIGGEAGQGEVLLAEGGLRIGGEAGQGEVLLAEGGLRIGGEAEQEQDTDPPYCSWSNQYTVTVAGVMGTSPCSAANQTYTLSHRTGNVWGVLSLGWTCSLSLGGPGVYGLTFFATGGRMASYTSSSFSCLAGGTFTRVSQAVCTGFPTTLTVTKV